MNVGTLELGGDLGAASSTHWLATGAAMAILEQGGNAFDAAATAGFVLQVVEPQSNGPGGDASIVLYSAATRETKIVCGQGPMPAAATIEAFDSLGLTQIPGSGLLPAAVPGAFGAWLRLLAEFGTVRLADALEPAIGYADRGYPLVPEAVRAVRALAPLFEEEWIESGRTYLPRGCPPRAGSRIRNPALAGTLRRLLDEGTAASADRERQLEAAHEAFYDGFVAERIGEFAQATEVLDATGDRHRGLLTAADLSGWAPRVEDAVSIAYGPYTTHKPGPWSQGPVFLQQLALLDGLDLAGTAFESGEYLHVVMEAAKLALADREAWYGDPDFADVPLEGLLSPAYSAARRSLIGDRAAADPQPGEPDGRRSWIPRPEPLEPAGLDEEWAAQLRNGLPTVVVMATARAGDTCTVAVADRHGNLVAAVPSGGWLKSSPIVPGLGFPLGTRGQAMCLAPGHPNSLAPGKRPRTTLSPTVVLRDDEPFLAFGTPGGDRQDQWTLEAFLAVTEFGLDLQAATETVVFHTDHFPSSFAPHACRPGVVVVEGQCDPDAVDDLRGRGHDVDLVPEYSLGAKVCAVGVDGDGFLRAAAGPRGRQAHAACR